MAPQLHADELCDLRSLIREPNWPGSIVYVKLERALPARGFLKNIMGASKTEIRVNADKLS
jgi:hypothetical protein